MNLEELQKMWDKDSQIDTDLYCEESVKTANLHPNTILFSILSPQ